MRSGPCGEDHRPHPESGSRSSRSERLGRGPPGKGTEYWQERPPSPSQSAWTLGEMPPWKKTVPCSLERDSWPETDCPLLVVPAPDPRASLRDPRQGGRGRLRPFSEKAADEIISVPFPGEAGLVEKNTVPIPNSATDTRVRSAWGGDGVLTGWKELRPFPRASGFAARSRRRRRLSLAQWEEKHGRKWTVPFSSVRISRRHRGSRAERDGAVSCSGFRRRRDGSERGCWAVL